MNKVLQGHSFEYLLCEAIADSLNVPIVKSDILLRRAESSAVFNRQSPQIALEQYIAASNLAQRLRSNINGSQPVHVAITDGSPDDIRIQKRDGTAIFCSVKWSDGVKENKGSRIGTKRGEYQRDYILGIPTDSVWKRTLESVDADMREIGKQRREEYPEAMIVDHMIALADVTQWQFLRMAENEKFVSNLIKSIYGNFDVVYMSAGRKNLDGTIRLTKSFSGGRITDCSRHNRSTVITIATNDAKKSVDIRHRVKIKEPHKMHGRISDYCYNISDDHGATFQL